VSLGAKLHLSEAGAPANPLFHAMEEIAQITTDLGQLYRRMGMHIPRGRLPGLRRSGGTPTSRLLMRDCHVVFEYTKSFLSEKRFTGPLIVRGDPWKRSCSGTRFLLRRNQLSGLIIESGFAFAEPLLELFGFSMKKLGHQASRMPSGMWKKFVL